MKRAPQLVPLSHDHHQGLVSSQHAIRLKEEEATLEVIQQHWTRIKGCLIDEAKHHFVIEERYILEPLTALGGFEEMVARIYREHELFREFVKQPVGESFAELQEIAGILKAHIKYEEREVFVAAQEHLTTAQLDELFEAHG